MLDGGSRAAPERCQRRAGESRELRVAGSLDQHGVSRPRHLLYPARDGRVVGRKRAPEGGREVLGEGTAREVAGDGAAGIGDMDTLAPLLPHAYAPVPRPSRPQPRTPPPAGAAGTAEPPGPRRTASCRRREASRGPDRSTYRSICRLTAAVRAHTLPLTAGARAVGAPGDSCAVCLWLHKGCGVRGWGPADLGTGA